MKKIIMTLCLLPILGLVACNEDDQFKGELYKKVIYVLSDDDLIFQSEHALGEESTGYLTLYCGGTEHISQDVTVEMEPDDDLLYEYNYKNFDLNESKYALPLPEENYDIDDFKTVLRASSPDSYSLLPIKIRPDGLSPDKQYMIAMRIKGVSAFEINPDKQRVLFNVVLKNDYATMLNTTYYQTTGRETRHTSAGDMPSSVSVTRIAAPVSKNAIRMFAGTHTYTTASVTPEEIDRYAMTVTFNEDHTLTIAPYGSIEIEQLGGPEDNYWYIDETLGHTVLVTTYRYKDEVTVNDAKETCWITMSETSIRRATTN
ncbi:MAG: DUF4361 domain-containing protein [Duncaniella sp.]|nr:DUF4361 domain-containing protein [Duncaniella sp.]